ncbi:Ank 2 domain containing protein [Trichuris trichiura]|uniref:Ank 2 domain containing protein n=1 Tax=Trichuris trichiura TaxID=36087 RepID=A0A077ZN51_TRITR|nr:Ank 2 domain containing protein [Trichuris trichiura]
MHEACNHGHYDIAELLIRQGADINRKSKSGTTPLIDAVINDHIDVIQLLLENGADVNVKDRHGQSALTHPCVRQFFRQQPTDESDKIDVDAEEKILIVAPPPLPAAAPCQTSSSQVEVAAAATVAKNESSSFVEEIDARASSAANVCTFEELPESNFIKTTAEVPLEADIISPTAVEYSTLRTSRKMSEEETDSRSLSPGGIRNMIASTSSDEVAAAVRTMVSRQPCCPSIRNIISRNYFIYERQ